MGDLTGGNNFQTIENCYVAANSSENLSWQPKIDTTKYYYYSPQGYEFEYLGGFMGFCGSSNSPGSVTIENNLFISHGLQENLIKSDRGHIYRFGYTGNELNDSNYAYCTSSEGMTSNGISLQDSAFETSIEPLASWDFSNIWSFDDTLNRPVLSNF